MDIGRLVPTRTTSSQRYIKKTLISGVHLTRYNVLTWEREACVRVIFAFVSFPIFVLQKVESLHRGAEWNWAVLELMFRISGETPHLGLGSPVGIPTEVVISDMGELMIMGLCVWPSLTRDPVHSSVGFSQIRTTWSWLLLAANLYCCCFSWFTADNAEISTEDKCLNTLWKWISRH